MMRNQLSNCIILMGIVLAQSPDELFNSAKSNLDSGNLIEAENGYKGAVEMDPTFAPAYTPALH